MSKLNLRPEPIQDTATEAKAAFNRAAGIAHQGNEQPAQPEEKLSGKLIAAIVLAMAITIIIGAVIATTGGL